jgi:hypothetical protein
MARRKNSDLLAEYTRELRRSRNWRDSEHIDHLWKRMIDLYRGRHYEKISNADRSLVNIAFATKNVIAPSVAVNNPRFTVMARRPEHAPQAVIAEEVLNYLWRAHKYQAEFRLAVDDMLCIGHGWVKVGYKFVKEPVIKPSEVGDDDSPDGVDDREEHEGNTESETKVVDDRPFAERISPFDIYVDPDARSLKEARWIAQRVRRPISDVRVDSRYQKKYRELVAATTRSRWTGDQDGADQDQRPDSAAIGYCDVIEFYDLRRKTVQTFEVEAEDGFLIPPKQMPYAFGHPFVMLRNYNVPDHFYPMGELEAIEILQHELNETRSQMLQHRKRFSRKWIYNVDAFDEEGLKALESDEDNTMVPAQPDGPLEGVVVPMPSIGTPPDFYNQSDLIQSDIDRISGVSDYMRGAASTTRKTATEAAMIQDAQNSRAQDKLTSIEGSLGEIGSRLIQLSQQFMTGEHVARLTGVNAWVNYDRDYIAGDFDFEVEGGSTQPRNETFRRQSALQLMDAMAMLVPMGVINVEALARHVLQFGFGIKDVERFMVQQQELPPGVQQVGAPEEPPMPQLGPGGGGMPPEALGGGSPFGDIPPELLAMVMAQGFNPSPQMAQQM